MNYIDIYNRITLNREDLPKETYGEVHHIWPKSLGQDNSPENLVRLTAKEHYVAHHLLTKIFPDCREMTQAFWLMCHKNTNSAKDVYVSPQIFAKARESAAKAHGELMSGRMLSTEHRAKISAANSGRHHSADAIKKIQEAKLGKRHSAAAIEKMREVHMELQSGAKNPRYDSTPYRFTHPEHGERTCTQYELRIAYRLTQQHLSNLIYGKRRTHKGWRCLGPAVVI